MDVYIIIDRESEAHKAVAVFFSRERAEQWGRSHPNTFEDTLYRYREIIKLPVSDWQDAGVVSLDFISQYISRAE